MNTESHERQANLENSRWPTCSMLMWGTFGTNTPAERRYLVRVSAAAGVTMAWFAVAFFAHLPRPIVASVTSLVVGVLITFIAWEFRRYLQTLDELARRMQLEAMAWTYLTGFVVVAWLAVIALLTHAFTHWTFNEKQLLIVPFLYFLLEPVRAGWLYYLSRRY